MSNSLLEHEEKTTPAFWEGLRSSSFPAPSEAPTAPLLSFEWQTDEDDSDHLTWHGDIDAVLAAPQGAFSHTFSAWVAVLHPDDQEKVLDAIQDHLISGEPYSIECRANCFDGTVLRWLHSGTSSRDENGNPTKLTGTLQLIPEHGELPTANNDLNGPETPVTEQIEEEPALESIVQADAPQADAPQADAPQADAPQAEVPQAEAPQVQPLPASEEESSAEQQVRADQARAQSLLRAAANLNAQLGLEDVCEAICEEAARTIGAPSAVMLFNKTLDAFTPCAVRGMPVDYEKRYIPTPRWVYEGHVAAMGTLFLFTDAQATPDLPNHQLYQEVNMRTIGIASLIREGEVLGLLKVYSFGESRTFDANELALLQGLADLAAQAIANARLLADSQRRLANLNALREIDKAILGSNDVNLVLGVVLEQVLSRLDADASSALLLDPHTRTLGYAAGRGFRTNTPRHTQWELGEGMAGRAALERRHIHVPDLRHPHIIEDAFATPGTGRPTSNLVLDEIQASSEKAHPFLRRKDVLVNEGFYSYHGMPLIANGQVKGVLEVWFRSPIRLDEEKVEFLETLAGQAAIAVDNATLFRDLQRTNDELALAYDSTLAGWSGALDLRDKETEGHSERVTRETLRLAREMGASAAELVNIRRGALLHDIGKMGIPDAILLKPGPLTDEEWLVMKKHPTYALELLSPIEYLRPALDIPYAHHEKWDGSGYPRGLSGEQIPLHARMFAVVDVWDALCSDRPYRQGWPIERVLNHIREASGTHFDPAVVEAFLRLHTPELASTATPESEASVPAPPVLAAAPAPPAPSATTETEGASAPEPQPTRRPNRFVRAFKILWGLGGAD